MKDDIQRWFRENVGRFTGRLLWDEPLSKHTYYRIGGPAAIFAVPFNEEDLRWLMEGIRQTRCPHFILGSGSNILASDAGYDGLIIRTSRLNLEMMALDSPPSRPLIRVGGSVPLPSLLRRAVLEGWGGLEFLAGIPGSIGGAVRMNAGTHVGETQDRLREVEAYSLLSSTEESFKVVYSADALKFSYRKNHFLPQDHLVNSTVWEVKLETPALVKSAVDGMIFRRKMTQPVDYPSCGSVFRNPKESGISAWQVIDRLGLRGHRIGNAQFAEKHSNFIINLGNAQAVSVRGLIDLAKSRAQSELGIQLVEEVIYL